MNGQITEQVDELERSDQGVILERPSKDAELDRRLILQVDGSVVLPTALFGMVHDFLRMILVAVSISPII